ncbi:MAG: glycosyl hydrolase [Sphingomonas taxi]
MVTRRTVMTWGAWSLSPGMALAASREPPAGTLSTPHASAATRRLYAWLWSRYGKQTLTGQQEQGYNPRGEQAELDYLRRVTGHQPAILGLDYIDPRDDAGVTARALAWARSGGIVTLCWHWGAPDIGTGYENAKKDFDVAAALRPGTVRHRLLIAQMDHVAGLLAILARAQVPVLWRPFHEFSGDWFWWGKHGPAAFKALWRLMHDRYTRVHRLDNLIWVLGWAGQNVDPAYHPGRATVDVAGADLYAADHGNLAPMFAAVKRIVGDSVPICLHENGPVPDPATLGPQADWLWFMTWHTRWLTGADQNTPDLLRRYYASDRYLTKEDLPAMLKAPR